MLTRVRESSRARRTRRQFRRPVASFLGLCTLKTVAHNFVFASDCTSMSSTDKTAADEGTKPDNSTPSASGPEAQAPQNATANIAADEEGSDLEELDG